MQTNNTLLSQLELDKDGFLKDLSVWSEDVARALAQHDGIELSPEHFEVLHVLRDFYQKHQVAPANRPFVKAIKLALGEEKGNSIYLMGLFPESPAKLAAKYAGLPKPANCL